MISVILPSVRPERLIDCLNGIVNGSIGIDVEIVLVTDYEIPLQQENIDNLKIKWVYDPVRKGVVNAINKGVDVARGEYLFSLSDEAILGEGALKHMEAFSQLNDNIPLLTPKHYPYYPFFYYKKAFAPFPFIHRSLLDKVGYFIDPAYKAFYADPDLSMRVWEAGYCVYEVQYASIHHPNNMSCPAHVHNVNEYLLQDRETFRKRWDHLGEFKDP